VYQARLQLLHKLTYDTASQAWCARTPIAWHGIQLQWPAALALTLIAPCPAVPRHFCSVPNLSAREAHVIRLFVPGTTGSAPRRFQLSLKCCPTRLHSKISRTSTHANGAAISMLR
jgi:hypothetical protein